MRQPTVYVRRGRQIVKGKPTTRNPVAVRGKGGAGISVI